MHNIYSIKYIYYIGSRAAEVIKKIYYFNNEHKTSYKIIKKKKSQGRPPLVYTLNKIQKEKNLISINYIALMPIINQDLKIKTH